MEIWGGNRSISSRVSMAGLDVRVFSRPYAARGEARAEGGDIHYLSSCATGRISRMIVADVSGHGEAVATVATNLRRLMCKFSNYVDQTRFVGAVNQRFHELHEEGDRFGALFATAVVATYFAPTDELSICNAGHPRPLRYDASRNLWEPILVEPRVGSEADEVPSNLPLGVLDGARFDQRVVQLGPKDLVLIHTDPLLEVRNPAGDQLGERGLLEMLGRVDGERPESVIDTLLDRLASFASGGSLASGFEFDDDVTMLLLRRNSAKPRPSAGLGVKAAARIVGHAARSIAGGDLPVSLPELRTDSILGAVFGGANRPRQHD
jgi:serine phosphatase RsbU (regulator of sigma subunit)